MADIVIFGGTAEGRKLAESLKDTQLKLHICVATEYGAELLPEGDNIFLHTGRLVRAEMEELLAAVQPDYCIDATHPYAAQVTANIFGACEQAGVAYLRVRRQEVSFSDTVFVSDVAEAAEYLSHVEGNIFITTGSKELDKYTVIPDYASRCVARVLPAAPVMERCKALGFEGKHIIGMQGPFSEEMNYCMLKESRAAWLVTKSSGKEGGYPEKCEAALRLGISILVVGRPEEEIQGITLEQVLSVLETAYGLNPEQAKERILYLVAMGPGGEALLTKEAVGALADAEVLFGAERVLDIYKGFGDKPRINCYKPEEILDFLGRHTMYKKAAVGYSGDIGFYSGAKGIWEKAQKKKDGKMILTTCGENGETADWQVVPVSGVSSVAYFLNRLGIPWGKVELASCHGRDADLISLLEKRGRVCTLLGDKEDVSAVSRSLLEKGLNHVRLTLGERLSYPEERILTGPPEEFLNMQPDNLSVLLLEKY